MADTNKNFGLVGIGGDVQFSKSGGRLVYSGSVFAVKNASGSSFVRLQVANASQISDAITKGQVDQAITNLQSEIDVLTNTSVVGTSGRISVAKSPQAWTVNLDPNYAGQGSITTVGTVTSGRWQSNTISTQYGGTGLTTYSAGDLLVGFGSSLTRLPIGSASHVLKVNSSGTGLEYGPAVDAALGVLVQTIQNSAGLAANGAYIANASAHYIGNVTSLANADARLDTALHALSNTVSNLSSDQIISTDQKTSVKAQSTGVELSGNVNNVRTVLLDVRASANTNTTLRFDMTQPGKAILRSNGIANTSVVLAPTGSGVVDHNGARMANAANASADSDAIVLGQANAAFMRYLTTTFAESNAVQSVGVVSGIVMRAIVLITTPFSSGTIVTVGYSTDHAAIVRSDEIDVSKAGLYVIERIVQMNQPISVYVTGTGAGSGRVIVEHLKV